MPKITIVDENDEVVGAAERSEVRAKGLRCRLARVFLRNSNGEILLCKRSDNQNDMPGAWDQSVGGHVDEGEDYLTAAKRETLEELGVTITDLQNIGKFYVEREGPGGFIRRFQTVFVGNYDGPIKFDRNEISEVKWFSIEEIDEWLCNKPNDFTKNFARAFGLLKDALKT